ncbi:SCP2 sterol-binding domain-containing protein [Rhodobacteraceae bacterium CCMM004]|nr:SCP2 sterol-binding domain-containing protein [Rhodobacteraceae bacterium CCMM004]
MSDTIDQAVTQLNDKIDGGFDGGTAKFVFEDEGTIMLDDGGARAGDDEADVTLLADTDTFREMFDGSLNPTAAFMSGRLRIEGDMGLAMKLAGVLG